MAGPLDGIRVLELPAIGPVPFLGMLLADLGAEVVRVDRRSRDGQFAGLPAGPLGRGRRSIALDVRQPGGAEVVLRLVERCNALIEGFRPGVAERLGIGPAEALGRNPKLVYGRMTGWGQHGPLANTAGHDITYLAISGLLHGIGPAETPVPPINYVADFGGGAMFLATGLLAALLHVRSGGPDARGQVVDAAMTEGAAYLGSMTRTFLSLGGWTDERAANMLDGGAPNYRCYPTSDGKWVAVGALEPQFWAALIETLGLADAPSPYDKAQWDACAATLTAAFRTKTRDEWADIFAPLDACVAPVLTLEEAPRHPHNVARGSYADIGSATLAAPAPKFSATPGETRPLTEIGAETEALLHEIGYDAADLARLRESGAIA